MSRSETLEKPRTVLSLAGLDGIGVHGEFVAGECDDIACIVNMFEPVHGH
jgi:hypothetical protein